MIFIEIIYFCNLLIILFFLFLSIIYLIESLYKFISLFKIINNIINTTNHRLSEHQSLIFLIQILQALDYLHNTLKICHRDIKPENILINYDSNKEPILKIIDFLEEYN